MGQLPRDQRLALLEADYGRAFGWYVERDGRRIAELLEPTWDADSQFWYRYRLVPLSDDPTEQAALRTEAFWADNAGALSYLNRTTGDSAEQAVPGGLEIDGQDRVWIAFRGLQVDMAPPNLLEKFLLWRRRG